MKKSLLMLALLGALTGCAGLDVAWELHATYLTKELQDKRFEQERQKQMLDGTEAVRQAEADRAAAALIAARAEAARK